MASVQATLWPGEVWRVWYTCVSGKDACLEMTSSRTCTLAPEGGRHGSRWTFLGTHGLSGPRVSSTEMERIRQRQAEWRPANPPSSTPGPFAHALPRQVCVLSGVASGVPPKLFCVP